MNEYTSPCNRQLIDNLVDYVSVFYVCFCIYAYMNERTHERTNELLNELLFTNI